ncbi:uncharacterized protein [Triticum aestivum]|nr:uncharacterized protein LOC123172864 isoform X1 [Triticum aestivum]
MSFSDTCLVTMRGSILYSSFRRISQGHPPKSSGFHRSSPLAAQRFGRSKRWIATSDGLPGEKMMLVNDLVCPVKYFTEEVPLLEPLDDNILLKTVGGPRGKTLVAWKAGKTIRSLPELIAAYQLRGCTLGNRLRLENLKISRSSGRFVLIDTSEIGPTEKKGSFIQDWNLGGDVLDTIARRVLGVGTPYPKDLEKYINNMRSAEPKLWRLLYNSLFLSPEARYWLRVYVNQMSREDFKSLSRGMKHKMQKFFGELPYQGGEEDEGSLKWLSKNEEFIRATLAESRKDAQNRVTGPNYLSTEEARKRDLGRWLVCVNRDGLTHGTRTKAEHLKDIKRNMLTAQNISQLLHVEFDELDQEYIDLCGEDNGLRELLSIEGIFFETPETWRTAIEALEKDIQAVRELKEKNLVLLT